MGTGADYIIAPLPFLMMFTARLPSKTPPIRESVHPVLLVFVRRKYQWRCLLVAVSFYSRSLYVSTILWKPLSLDAGTLKWILKSYRRSWKLLTLGEFRLLLSGFA